MRIPKLHLLFGQLQANSQQLSTIFQRKRIHTCNILHGHLVLHKVLCLKQLCFTRKSFLPSFQQGVLPLYIAWPGFALCPKQKYSKQWKLQDQHWKKLVLGWCCCRFQVYTEQRRKQQKVCEIHERVGLVLNITWQCCENAGFDFSCSVKKKILCISW